MTKSVTTTVNSEIVNALRDWEKVSPSLCQAAADRIETLAERTTMAREAALREAISATMIAWVDTLDPTETEEAFNDGVLAARDCVLALIEKYNP